MRDACHDAWCCDCGERLAIGTMCQRPDIDLHGRWKGRGTTTQDLYDANSIVRRVSVSERMGAAFGSGI